MEPQGPEALSAREREILELVATGVTNQQVAQQLGISVNTVKAHLRSIFGKLDAESRTEATRMAIEMGLISVGATAPPDMAAQAVPLADSAEPDGQDLPSGPDVRALVHGWSLAPAQIVLLVLALAGAVALVFWPSARAARAAPVSRFADRAIPSSLATDERPGSRWHARAAMPTERARFAQIELDGVIYVIGGQTASGTTANVEALDLRLDRWTPRAPKPTAVANVGAALVGGRIYVPGGYNAAGRVIALLEVYNPADDTWSRAAAPPLPLCAYAIAGYEHGFYVFGGWDGERYMDQVLHYDAEADRWQVVGHLGKARGFLASAVANDRIYLLGGYDDRVEYDLVESFDPAKLAGGEDPWEQHAAMGAGRAGHAAVAIDGQIYVVGGGWEGYLAHNLRYDVANDVWSTFETPIIGEWRTLGLSGARAEDGTRLYAIGGWADRFLAVVQVYQASYRLYLP